MSLPVNIRRSNKAKRLRLEIESGKLELTVIAPRHALDFQIQNFLKRQERWIEKHWKKAQEKSQLRPTHLFRDGDIYFYFGEILHLKLVPSVNGKPHVRVVQNVLEISLHEANSEAEGKSLIRQSVQDFYKKKAEEVIHDRLHFFNEHYRLKYNRVTFRNQKTRWGSCSAAKNLNFNWRLIMAPIEVLDYVVAHELCHLKHMNHSAAFWKLVSEAIPQYKENRRWLKENHFLLSFE